MNFFYYDIAVGLPLRQCFTYKSKVIIKKGTRVIVPFGKKSIVGIVKVVKEFYPDPTDETGKFVVVDVKATKKLKNVVLLNDIKKNKKLQNIALIKQSRLSVMPLKKLEWNIIIKMSSL